MEKTTIRSTIDFDKDFHKELKMASVITGVSMKVIITTAAKQWIKDNVKK